MKIDLTSEEGALLATIELEALKLENGQPARENGERAAQLVTMLLDRDAIPNVRKKVFSAAEYATGPGPSVAEQFRRNGNSHEQTIRHPHFLEWLRYFIFGAQLPDTMIEAYKRLIDELQPLTSGDAQVLRKFTRQQVRQHGLEKSQSDEVYKLILEFDEVVS